MESRHLFHLFVYSFSHILFIHWTKLFWASALLIKHRMVVYKKRKAKVARRRWVVVFDWSCLEPFRGTCLGLGKPFSLLSSRSKRVSRTTRPWWVARIHGSPRHPIRWSRLPCDQAQSNNRWSAVSSRDQNSLPWVLFALRARQWKGPRTGLRWGIYECMIHPTWICWGPRWWRAVFSSGPVVQGAMKT